MIYETIYSRLAVIQLIYKKLVIFSTKEERLIKIKKERTRTGISKLFEC